MGREDHRGGALGGRGHGSGDFGQGEGVDVGVDGAEDGGEGVEVLVDDAVLFAHLWWSGRDGSRRVRIGALHAYAYIWM